MKIIIRDENGRLLKMAVEENPSFYGLGQELFIEGQRFSIKTIEIKENEHKHITVTHNPTYISSKLDGSR